MSREEMGWAFVFVALLGFFNLMMADLKTDRVMDTVRQVCGSETTELKEKTQ